MAFPIFALEIAGGTVVGVRPSEVSALVLFSVDDDVNALRPVEALALAAGLATAVADIERRTGTSSIVGTHAREVARLLFASRPGNVELHLKQDDLSNIIEVAIEKLFERLLPFAKPGTPVKDGAP
jgi:hypothetical protein